MCLYTGLQRKKNKMSKVEKSSCVHMCIYFSSRIVMKILQIFVVSNREQL